jgi:hypothetical protein
MKKGRIIKPDGLRLEPHEDSTARILKANGFTVEFLFPLDAYKTKTADCLIDNTLFEIKSPVGNSKTTIQNQFKRAVRQSKNIVFDLRRTKIPDNLAIKQCSNQFHEHHKAKRLLIITKSGTILAFDK